LLNGAGRGYYPQFTSKKTQLDKLFSDFVRLDLDRQLVKKKKNELQHTTQLANKICQKGLIFCLWYVLLEVKPAFSVCVSGPFLVAVFYVALDLRLSLLF
jgi:hypothetical protein